ncbi:MAG: UvrY/SirA/GacA family response regulator transcription factor [Chromatiales bacterium]|nr:UvrY/SirA/GacA family response regulator transcription factor [Chromatiales bacterium]
MINVLLVDDHDLVRTGIRRLLDDVSGIKVYAEAGSGEDAISSARKTRPDVVLMDVSMPGIGGLEATRKLKQIYPDLPIIIVTVHTDAPFPSSLLKAGATGYLHKGVSVDEIISAIKAVHNGQRYISADIAQNLALSLLPGNEGSPFETLSQREMQVMIMLVQGNKVQHISDKLCLSPKTISTYRTRLFDKLNVGNDAELTRLAMHHGILDGL